MEPSTNKNISIDFLTRSLMTMSIISSVSSNFLTIQKIKKLSTLQRLFVLIVILNGNPVLSQDLELAGFSFTRFPGAEVEGAQPSQEIEVNEFNFFVNIPKLLKNKKTILINGLQYKLLTPFVENDQALGINGENLHLIGYRLMALHKLKKDWSLLAVLNPTLSSSFNTSLEGDDWLLNGTFQFLKQKTDRLSYGGGLMVTSRFGNPTLLPAFQLKLKTDRSQFHVFLPRSIIYERFFGDLTVGIQAIVDGSLYNVNFNFDTDRIDKVAYTRVIVGPKLSYRIGKILQLEASGGITAGRSVELQSERLDDQINDVETAPFFQIGISILPPKK